MSLDNTQCYVSYTGNGATRTYAAPFPVPDKAHIVISGTQANGTTTFKYTQGVDYQVTLNTNATGEPVSATIVLTNNLPSGWKMNIARILPIVQLVDLFNQGGMDPEVIEAALDYITMILQQIDYGTFSGNAQMQEIVNQYAALRSKDNDLQAQITNLGNTKADKTALTSGTNNLQAQINAINTNKPSKTEVDNALAQKADTNAVAGYVGQLQNQITNLGNTKADKTAVATADTLLQSQIDALKGRMPDAHSLAEEIAAREEGDRELQNAIDAETAARTAVDLAQADAIAQKVDKQALDAAVSDKAPLNHAARHAASGEDPITPPSIGALDKTHTSAANPHPQYALRGDYGEQKFFIYDPVSKLVRLRESAVLGDESQYFTLPASGLVSLKGNIYGGY